MSNRNSSAGTAAQKSSKCSLIQRPAIILAILLLCAVFCQGQTKYNLSKMMIPLDTVCMNCHFYPLLIGDNTKNVAWLNLDSTLTVIDSAATIKVLITELLRQQDMNERLYAAMGVLSTITTRGKVTDINAFKKALKRYNAVSK